MAGMDLQGAETVYYLGFPTHLCASVLLCVSAVKLFIPVLNKCIIGMNLKIPFFPPNVSFQTIFFFFPNPKALVKHFLLGKSILKY